MIRSGGVVGDPIAARAQVNINDSWRRVASSPEQTGKMNWHLRKATSTGLIGELGVHSLDVINWYMKSTPVSVVGSGAILKHKDGREVPDTAECTIEYAGGARCQYASTLASQFDKTYELLMGSLASLMVRGQHAWLFKEVDAPLLGWEVYAKQEDYGPVSTADRERGFVLIADATKIINLGKKPGEDGTMLDAGKDALYYSLEAFLNSARDPAKNPPACGPADALKATVTALKANEAALTGTKITYQKEWFTI
jgi:predicted dehydrogenase